MPDGIIRHQNRRLIRRFESEDVLEVGRHLLPHCRGRQVLGK